ncbi:AraC family transcriptional regulator [Bacillus sp. PS06]|uniref:AraC family transcriptional regulator n=1 Tax=Bacillus sp. PS06 TaxID=2764176 RepID=UPI00178677D1|nr:helix-turn-helix domain-containing protein [Bacillus sp. PS06]MBD8068622.1 helix-turn-helix domain-containing protein [Bacillus sp. PS06]
MPDLLEELMEITDEEQALLEQNKEVLRDIYTSQANFIIESEKFLSKEKMIMVRKHTRFIDFPKHKHNYIEINYVYNGSLTQKVGNETITLKKGELLFLNQHIEHEISACAKEDIILNFIIQPQFFEFIFSYLSSNNIISDFLINSIYNNTQSGQFLYFAVAEVEEIQELLEKIIVEIMKPSFLSDSTSKLYMGLLLLNLIKHSDKIAQTKEELSQPYILVESLKYIEERYPTASLFELAEMLHQPHYSLSKYIKKATKFTFKELLQEKRLSKAKELLESTKLSVTSIAEQVGYDNISYFYRIFKNKYGYTPKKYREHLSN